MKTIRKFSKFLFILVCLLLFNSLIGIKIQKGKEEGNIFK